jgi:hypothetical protein
MFFSLINRPTRITAHSATLIDNIFSNHLSDKRFTSIVFNDISDHLPVFSCSFDKSTQNKYQDNRRIRDHSNKNLDKFRAKLLSVKGQQY